jgi:hypothetical protein
MDTAEGNEMDKQGSAALLLLTQLAHSACSVFMSGGRRPTVISRNAARDDRNSRLYRVKTEKQAPRWIALVTL